MTYRDTKEKCHHTLRLHIPEHFKSFSLVLLTELMQSAGVGEFVLVFSRAIFWPCGQDKHKKLTDRFTHQNVFSVDWKHIERESSKCHIYAFFKKLFLHFLFSVLFLHMQQRKTVPKDPETDAPFWREFWMQKLWFYLSGMIAKMTKRALDDIRGLVN